MPKAKKAGVEPAIKTPVVCTDRERRCCLLVSHDGAFVEYIPFSMDGFHVQRDAVDVFDQRYHPLGDYPPERCAQLFASYARDLGATKEALEHLGRLTKLSPQEIEMATKKQAQTDERKTTAATPKKAPAGKKVPTPKKEPVAKKTTAKEPGAKKPSAAQRFMELIRAGKLTDDQIFAAVQKEFGLDDTKKGYVRWYRNHLIKQGEKVPVAKA